jgi:hypothetical protein
MRIFNKIVVGNLEGTLESNTELEDDVIASVTVMTGFNCPMIESNAGLL